MVTKIDLKKELKEFYAPSATKIGVVNVPEFNFVMIDGYMEPSERPATSVAFQNAIAALEGVSFTLKSMSKMNTRKPIDYAVMALEALWWVDSGNFDFQSTDRWRWTLLTMQPKHITETMVARALEDTREKIGTPAATRLRFGRFREGLSIQTMHVGPYHEEPRTMARMRSFASENGYRYRGKHHEIYLGDPRRAKPDKLRTILRQPVEK
ncbi:MAG: GyrI-like domain-containing protein [Acidobacteriia bacterium]|nr:GyrI-like domain-containing protein [Terriglobia bacterium]